MTTLDLAAELRELRVELRELRLAIEAQRHGPLAPAPVEEAAPLLLTVPTAAKETGLSADTLRRWIEVGRLPRRTKSTDPHPKRPTFLVSLDEVRAASEGRPVRR